MMMMMMMMMAKCCGVIEVTGTARGWRRKVAETNKYSSLCYCPKQVSLIGEAKQSTIVLLLILSKKSVFIAYYSVSLYVFRSF